MPALAIVKPCMRSHATSWYDDDKSMSHAPFSWPKTKLLPPGINIILHIRPDDILGRGLFLTAHPGALMQQAPFGLAVREHGHAALDRLHWVRVEDALARRGQEEGRLARRELVVEVDQEREEGRLLCVGRAGVVLVCVVREDA